MGEVSLEKRFVGQARLVRLLLWRVGDSTDIDACLSTALEANMLTPSDAAFLRDSMEAEERSRENSGVDLTMDADTVSRLQRCADKLNRADSA